MLSVLKIRFHATYQLSKWHDTRIVKDIDSTDANSEKRNDKEKVQNKLDHSVDHALPPLHTAVKPVSYILNILL